MLRILYVGALWSGATSAQRKQAFSELGHRVLGVDTEPPSTLRLERRLLYRIESRVLKSGLVPGHAGIPDRAKANLQLLERIQQDQFDVLWLDRGLTIRKATLAEESSGGLNAESSDTVVTTF